MALPGAGFGQELGYNWVGHMPEPLRVPRRQGLETLPGELSRGLTCAQPQQGIGILSPTQAEWTALVK